MQHPMTRRHFLSRCSRCAILCASAAAAPWAVLSSPARGAELKKGFIKKMLSPYFTSLENGTIRCDLCPHRCEVEPGERGLCEVRENIGGKYYSLTYANPCAVHVDPIEKKPFFHVLPTSQSFSIATAGCNFDCKFCQNWEISQARPEDTFNYEMDPEQVVQLAGRYGCRSIASTYVEPTIFFEYMLAVARLAKKAPLLKVMHSNGFINPTPLDELCNFLDAACIDLKGFSQEYYRDMAGGSLAPVLDTLKHLKAKAVHTEIVNLVVPGKNDDPAGVLAMCRWIKNELGPDTPLHFSRFYPRYKLKGIAPTPVETLEKARQTAMAAGLHYVYIGNVASHPGENTYCPNCRRLLIKRVGYSVGLMEVKDGNCRFCGRPIAGIWKDPA
ncbi:MAG: AmmeMemoRadiSam system radical SAM enzyme [Thermodesulfobacteriota bacterium]